MISSFHVQIVKAGFLSTVIAALTISCTGFSSKPVTFDAASVKGMVFNLQRNSVTEDIAESDNQAIAAQVSANLSSWGYSVSEISGSQTTHRLEGSVGEIKKSSTPTGFSFSSGNSDPRALDFQKAKIVPVSCSLIAIGSGELLDTYTMEFSAASGWSGTELSMTSDKLIDWVSTTCLNQLKELNINEINVTTPGEQSKQTVKPGWAPDVLIEVETVKEVEQPLPKTAEPVKNIRVEKEPRKQMTIHNQGTPLILKFGRDRHGN
jgi:hypothetical protein